MSKRGEKKLRVFAIYMNPFYKENDAEALRILQGKLRKWCEMQQLNKVAMVWIPSPVDAESAQLFKINPEAKNTVFVYKKRKVASKWVDIEYNEATARSILNEL